MPLTVRPTERPKHISVHVWGPPKTGKTRFALSAPRPALINFDRSEDWLLDELGLQGILRDRIIAPPGDVTPPVARELLRRFEQDVAQAKAMASGGLVETLIIDGFGLCMELITIVTLDEAPNRNITYRYAGRNAYLKNLFCDLGAAGFNLVVTSKARPLWSGDQRVPGAYVPDCHEEVSYAAEVSVRMKAERRDEGPGINYGGILEANAFNERPVGVEVPNLTWAMMVELLAMRKEESGQLGGVSLVG